MKYKGNLEYYNKKNIPCVTLWHILKSVIELRFWQKA